MKKIIVIFLLFTAVLQAQNYTFESIEKCKDAHDWEIREIPGTVTINDTIVVIQTEYNILVLEVSSALQLYSQDDKILSCRNEQIGEVKIRLVCNDQLRKYFDLLYYSQHQYEKYFRFCLTKI